MEEEKLPFPIDDLPITFSEPIKEPTVLLDTPFGEVLENFQEEILQTYFEEPVPFEVPLPFEEIPVECFVQKQASYGLLDNKYLIRY